MKRGVLVPVLLTAAGVTEICPASDKRTALIISGSITNDVWVSTHGNVASGTGLPINAAAQNPLHLDIETHGDLVQRAWFAFSAGAVTIAVIQVEE